MSDEKFTIKVPMDVLQRLAQAPPRQEYRAQALSNLGDYYLTGTWVEQDKEAAVKFYQLAANEGSAGAQNNLGVCYENGVGVEKDLTTALRFYQSAAQQGNAEA